MTKRAQKKVAGFLGDEGILEGAVVREPRGTYGLGMFKLAFAPDMGQQSLNREQARQKEGQMDRLVFGDGGGIEGDIPMGQPLGKLRAELGSVAPIR